MVLYSIIMEDYVYSEDKTDIVSYQIKVKNNLVCIYE